MTIGDRRHLVTFENPAPAVPDGDGGYTQTWASITPTGWHVSIEPATPQDLERFTAGTVITQATNLVTGRFHAGVSSATRMVFGGRPFAIVGVRNKDKRSIDMELLAVDQES